MERPDKIDRILKPEDILLPTGYKIEVFAEKLTTPINLTFTDQGEMLIADAGITRGNGKVLILTSTGTRVIAEGFKPPFGPVDEVFIAEFGSEAPNTTGGKPAPRVGHRISKINTETRTINTFAINSTGLSATATGGGGLERPIDVTFGKQNEMLITAFGIFIPPGKKIYHLHLYNSLVI